MLQIYPSDRKQSQFYPLQMNQVHPAWQKTIRKKFVTQMFSIKNDCVSVIINVNRWQILISMSLDANTHCTHVTVHLYIYVWYYILSFLELDSPSCCLLSLFGKEQLGHSAKHVLLYYITLHYIILLYYVCFIFVLLFISFCVVVVFCVCVFCCVSLFCFRFFCFFLFHFTLFFFVYLFFFVSFHFVFFRCSFVLFCVIFVCLFRFCFVFLLFCVFFLFCFVLFLHWCSLHTLKNSILLNYYVSHL